MPKHPIEASFPKCSTVLFCICLSVHALSSIFCSAQLSHWNYYSVANVMWCHFKSKYWQLLVIVGYCWLLLAIVGYCWLLLAIVGNFWLLLAIVCYCWLVLAIVGNCWQLLTIVGYCWLLLAIVDYCCLLLAIVVYCFKQFVGLLHLWCSG